MVQVVESSRLKLYMRKRINGQSCIWIRCLCYYKIEARGKISAYMLQDVEFSSKMRDDIVQRGGVYDDDCPYIIS